MLCYRCFQRCSYLAQFCGFQVPARDSPSLLMSVQSTQHANDRSRQIDASGRVQAAQVSRSAPQRGNLGGGRLTEESGGSRFPLPPANTEVVVVGGISGAPRFTTDMQSRAERGLGKLLSSASSHGVKNFGTNTGGKLPNHVFHLSSASQIPLLLSFFSFSFQLSCGSGHIEHLSF